MLLKRLDVTLQSFLWGASAQGREGEMLAVIQAQRQHLTESPSQYTVLPRFGNVQVSALTVVVCR